MLNLPLFFTLIRLLIAPLLMPFLLVTYLPINTWFSNTLLTVIFLSFGLTDFLDGYFARRYNRETTLGRLLDPLADKCLLYATLIALVAVGKLYFFWAIIMIGREFFVMSLREIALVYGFSVPVGYWGKIKTIVQIICLAFIILNPYHILNSSSAAMMNSIESFLLVSAITVTLYSAYYYFRQFHRHWYLISQ